MSAREQAAGKWRSVLTQLGIDERVLNKRHHPCPANGAGTDRFRFNDRNGSGNYFCACSNGDKGGMSLLMCCKGITYAEAAKQVESIVGTCEKDKERPPRDPRAALNRIRKSLGPAGDTVQGYLAARGVRPTAAIKESRQPYWHGGERLGEYDCMVTLIQSPDGKPQSYHLTYLSGPAKAEVPAPRKMMKPVDTVTGGAVRLCPAAEEMGIAEGIETALSATALFKVPTWAALTAGGMESFVPPPECKHLTIFADNDASYTGHAAAYSLAKRLTRQGIECLVMIPDRGDWNDALLQKQNAESRA